MTATAKAAARWIITQVLVITAIWFGVVEGVSGAGNLVIAWAWFGGFVTFAAYMDNVVEEAIMPVIPQYMHALVNFPIIATLIWYGWFWTAAIWMVSYANIYVYRTRVIAKFARKAASDAALSTARASMDAAHNAN